MQIARCKFFIKNRSFGQTKHISKISGKHSHHETPDNVWTQNYWASELSNMSQAKLNKAKSVCAVKSEAPNGQAHIARLDMADNSKPKPSIVKSMPSMLKIVEWSTFLQCLDQAPPHHWQNHGTKPYMVKQLRAFYSCFATLLHWAEIFMLTSCCIGHSKKITSL